MIDGCSVPVLDHGFVRLLDVMGTDMSICQAARQSYDAEARPPREDRRLIRYMMSHGHTSPFEQAVLQFQIRLPIFVERQWARHRTGRWNEYSMRYSEAIDDCYRPAEWRAQDESNKQGSDGLTDEQAALSNGQAARQRDAFATYRKRIDAGVAREQARIDLPLSMYTVKTWQMDLHNLLHFLRLRCDSHAQWEIRQYAIVIASMVEQLFPLTWEAFCDYRRDALTLSRMEVDCLSGKARPGDVMGLREQMEFFDKKWRLGL